MATPYAFVTLLSSDSYLPGALALVAALKEVHPKPPVPPEVDFQTVCLVTPETVDVSSIKLLRKSFDLVVGVEVIEQRDLKGLKLLGKFMFNSIGVHSLWQCSIPFSMDMFSLSVVKLAGTFLRMAGGSITMSCLYLHHHQPAEGKSRTIPSHSGILITVYVYFRST